MQTEGKMKQLVISIIGLETWVTNDLDTQILFIQETYKTVLIAAQFRMHYQTIALLLLTE